jgi:hypothetical protein
VIWRLSATPFVGWETRVWNTDIGEAFEVNLFGRWYMISLTSSPANAAQDLQNWAGRNAEGAYWIADHGISPVVPITS